MTGYYEERLAGERLRACYEIAPPAVKAYLEAEIAFVAARTSASARLLELGCGYGRALRALAPRVRKAVGIDTSLESLALASGWLAGTPNVRLAAMDAARLAVAARSFDLTVCLQNGLSAFAVDPIAVVTEAVRVTRPGGVVLLASYSERFWRDRLAWFEAQAALGLIGAIDDRATGDGVIVCRDGFRATTFDERRFTELAARLGLASTVTEVAGASLVLEIPVQ